MSQCISSCSRYHLCLYVFYFTNYYYDPKVCHTEILSLLHEMDVKSTKFKDMCS